VIEEPEFPFTVVSCLSPIGIEQIALFITRELHSPKALGRMGFAASIKSTQQGQRDRVEVVYVQNPPTLTTLVVSTGPLKSGCRQAGDC
jgi:hypothetical protein